MIDQFVTFVYTRDLAAAEFYETILGLTACTRSQVCAVFIASVLMVSRCLHRPIQHRSHAAIIPTLVTDEVDASVPERLPTSWRTRRKTPQLNPRFNIYHLFVRDPDGYLIEIQTFLDPKWPR